MGGGRWDPKDWGTYTTVTRNYASSTVDDIYSRSLDPDLDPKSIKMRESRDSVDNPKSTPLIVALDVTGSMSMVLDAMARQGLNTLVSEVYDRKPITDPHVMCMGIGDAEAGDRAPLQATQFEADLRIAKALEKLYLEQGGGGNNYESYALAWYFAATRTSIDSFEKRGKKGYLFTLGDEEPTPYLRAADIERVLGDKLQADLQISDLLTMVSRQWEVFHLIVEEGSHAHAYPDRVKKKWRDLLGQNVIQLADHTKMGEVIVSTLQVREGMEKDKVADSWDGTTSIVVKKAISGLVKGSTDDGSLVKL